MADRELEFLMNEHKPSGEKINKLVSWLPRKGRDALKNFVKCLEESDEGTGHRTVAEKITNMSYSARKYSYKLDHPIGKIKAVSTSLLRLVVSRASLFLGAFYAPPPPPPPKKEAARLALAELGPAWQPLLADYTPNICWVYSHP